VKHDVQKPADAPEADEDELLISGRVPVAIRQNSLAVPGRIQIFGDT
jgi:hypothetical protein